MARPSKCTPETTAEIIKWLRAGNSQKDSALLSGISEKTYYEWMKTKREFRKPIKKAERECKARNIAIILKASEKSWQAAAWYLERRYSSEFALKTVTEHQGGDKPLMIALNTRNETSELSGSSKVPAETT